MSDNKAKSKETSAAKENEPKKIGDEPIIVFDNVTKVYTLYKNSREQFCALFYNSKKFR